jgi:large subunit ribosomal protein L21e
MVRRSQGIRSNTRQKMRVTPRRRGKVPVTKTLRIFRIGEKAAIKIEPRIHKGQPHAKFQGLTGEIVGTQGKAYYLKVRDGGKLKRLLVRPEHLKRVK